MEKLKLTLAEHGLKFVVGGFFILLGLLLTQQMAFNAELKADMRDTCAKFDKQLTGKVNNETVIMLMKSRDREQEYRREQWDRQYKVNERHDMKADEILRSVNELTKNVILLNEKMKK